MLNTENKIVLLEHNCLCFQKMLYSSLSCCTALILLCVASYVTAEKKKQELTHPFPNVTCGKNTCYDEDDGPNSDCPGIVKAVL